MLQPNFDALPLAQRDLWPKLGELPADFVLYGGTAVALRCGHRISEDFDLFSALPFQPDALAVRFTWLQGPGSQILQRAPNTLSVSVLRPAGAVKLSFFGHLAFGQICPPDRTADSALKIASPADLLALKLGVIQQRVETKDYLDIHALLQSGLSLADGLANLEALHPLSTNPAIALRALVYFEGGDLAALPLKVRQDLISSVRQVRTIPTPPPLPLNPIGST